LTSTAFLVPGGSDTANRSRNEDGTAKRPLSSSLQGNSPANIQVILGQLAMVLTPGHDKEIPMSSGNRDPLFI
jgi:hypothetical protein